MLILTTHEAVTNAIERYSQIVPVGILQRYAAMLKEEPIVRLFILQPGDSAELLAQLRGQFVDVHRVGIANYRNNEALIRVCSKTDVVILFVHERLAIGAQRRIHFREFLQRGDAGFDYECEWRQ